MFWSAHLTREIVDGAKGGTKGAKAAKAYYKLINNGTFFARSPEESLSMLYDAYIEHPRIALGCAQEMDGGEFDPVTPAANSPAYRDALYKGHNPFIQACMYWEHRARLSILKSAVDYGLKHPESGLQRVGVS